MSIEYKDYYKILGLERNASGEDIRKAFRRLARQYHPDVAKNKKESEEKFKEINEANEVLGDPEKRKRYDALGANWKQGTEFRPPPGWQPFGGGSRGGARGGQPAGADFEFDGTGFSDFFEQIFGQRGAGAGFGFDPQNTASRGRDIQADLMVTLDEALRGSVRTISLRRAVPCESCRGTGVSGRTACARCGGTGETVRTETHQVKIPPGVTEGQRLRVGGKGETGSGGGAAGDLFLTVRLAGHPDFRAEGGNLFHELDLAPWEAVLGASVAVPTLEGEVNIRIPPGTQTGQRLRVRGRGLGRDGSRGDLFVEVQVQVPSQLNESEKELWQKLAEESRFDPRG